jgi:hypothetical protein
MQLSDSTDTGAASRFEHGQDVTIHLTGPEVQALGLGAAELYDWFTSALRALVMLRTGVTDGDPRSGLIPDVAAWAQVIGDLDHHLAPRLEGIRAGAIRAFDAAGGSHQQLAYAMDVSRSTAQDRRTAVLAGRPGLWERWAATYPGQRIPNAE